MEIDKNQIKNLCHNRPAEIGSAEILELYDKYIKDLDKELMIEIGIRSGGSAKIFNLMGFKKIIGIELNWDQLKVDIQNDVLIKIQGNSIKESTQDKFIDVFSNIKEKSVNLLHIDGAHEYEFCIIDYSFYSEFVSDDGVILFHDIGDPNNGVRKVFDEVKHEWKINDIIHIDHAGFGVLKERITN